MRVAVCLLSLAVVCLAAPPPLAPGAAKESPPRLSAAPAPAATAAPAASPAPAAAPAAGPPQRKGAVSALEGDDDASAPADDLKTDATFWGGWGWGYPRYYARPRYYTTYSVPYTYSAPYWGGWSGWKSYGWNSYW